MLWNLDLSSLECKNKKFAAIDLGKFICALLVIATHVNPFIDVNGAAAFILGNVYSRLIVPFFCITGGYLCFRKTNENFYKSDGPINYAMKLIKLYVIWVAIYLPVIITNIAFSQFSLSAIILNLQQMFIKGYDQLWYLMATSISVLAIGFLLKKKVKIETIVAIFGVFYLFGSCGDVYYGITKDIPVLNKVISLYLTGFANTRNLEAPLFIAVGALFAYRKIIIKNWIAIVGLIVSLALMLVEVYWVKNNGWAYDWNLCLVKPTAGFFIFYIVSRINAKPNKLTATFRTSSSLIYFMHMWFKSFALIAVGAFVRLFDKNFAFHSTLLFFVVTVITLYATFIIMDLSKRKHFKWLKKLY